MSPVLWIAIGVAAALLADLLVVRLRRLRRAGKSIELPALRLHIPPLVPVILLLAGTAAVYLGQSLESTQLASDERTSRWLTLSGVLAFAASGAMLRGSFSGTNSTVDGHSTPTQPAESMNQPRKASGKQLRSSRNGLAAAPRVELGALLLAAAVLLFLGSSMTSYLAEGLRAWSYAYLALGLACFVLAALGFSGRGLPVVLMRGLDAAGGWLSVSPAQIVLLGLAPLLALSTWLAAGESVLMRQPAIAVLGWLAAMLLVVIGGAPQLPRLRRLKFSAPVLGFGGIFLAAFLLRGLATGQIPWLFTGDEASAGLSAAQFIEGFRDNLFGVAWFSFPSLFFFVQSLFVRIFGQTAEALRILSALAGALTVPVTFALANEMFGKRVAWASAAYLAAFHFHIHFSRIGLNNIWDGFFMAAFSAAFWRAWKSDSRLAFAAAGIVLGLSQYFYVSIRVVVPLFVLWLIAAGISDRSKLRSRLPGLSILLLGLIVTALPLAIFFARHPLEFQAPLGRVAALGPWVQAEAQNTGRAVWEVLLSQFRYAALGFTSVNLRLAYEPGQPMLLALPATLFLMGVSLMVLRVRQLRSVWMILWLIAAIFVGALSLSPPGSQRYILVAPAVAILVALPLITVAEWLAELWPAWRRAIVSAAIAVLALAAWGDLRFYFGDYTIGTAFGDINTETAQQLAELLAEKDADTFVYFLGGRMGFRSHSNVPYLAPHVDGSDLPEPLSPPLDLTMHDHTLFVVLPERSDELELIQQAYPGGRTFQREGRQETLFIAYEIGGS